MVPSQLAIFAPMKSLIKGTLFKGNSPFSVLINGTLHVPHMSQTTEFFIFFAGLFYQNVLSFEP